MERFGCNRRAIIRITDPQIDERDHRQVWSEQLLGEIHQRRIAIEGGDAIAKAHVLNEMPGDG